MSWPARRCHHTSKSATGKQPNKNARAGSDSSRARRQGSRLSGCGVALGVGFIRRDDNSTSGRLALAAREGVTTFALVCRSQKIRLLSALSASF